MEWLTEYGPGIVALAGAIVVVARIVVRLTPTDRDNALLDYVVAFCKLLALYIAPSKDEVEKALYPGERRR